MVRRFYLSRIIGNKIFTSDSNEFLGNLQDLVVNVNEARPKIIAAKVKKGNKSNFISFTNLALKKENGHYSISCKEAKDTQISTENTMFLVHHILDKQLVDINGRKLVRVNDVSCAMMQSGEIFVIAVDIGLEGLLRRLGIAKTAKKLLNIFKKSIPTEFILWDNVQTILNPRMDIKLATPYSKLLSLHPSDLADIIEDLDKKSQAAIFASLDEEKAADVLEELETEAQINVLNSLPIEKAADVLEKMPADEAADILDDIKEETAEEILNEMDKEVSEEVKELMEYPDGTVGSLMATDLFHLNKDLRVSETINELRRLQPEEKTVYYLYVTDKKQRLCGVVSLWKLVISAPDKRLEEIMDSNILFVNDMDDINDMINIISKYNLLSIPVVDEKKVLIGKVIVNDVVYELLKPKRRRG